MAKRKTKKPANKSLFAGTFPTNLSDLPNEVMNSFTYHGEIEKGKTGITYRVCPATNPHHTLCLKTVQDNLSPEVKQRAAQSITEEIEILLPLNHVAIPKIYYHGKRGNIPFYICTFHPGKTFDAFARDKHSIPFSDALYAIRQLIDVVGCLHEQGRTHCDLHANNILISEKVFQDGLLVIDFGSGHRESGSGEETSNRGNVFIKPNVLKASHGQPINRSVYLQEFQLSDFTAIGMLLGRMQNSFLNDASPAQRQAYIDFAEAMQTRKLTQLSEIRDYLDFVADPHRAHSHLSRTFLDPTDSTTTLNIPLNGTIAVGTPVRALIESETFQRLRGIKQLSFCDWHFPGANHTRYEHSLGVFANSLRTIQAMVQNHTLRRDISPTKAKAFVVAALLHDIGHYPFAHVIEQYAAGRFPDNPQLLRTCSHEKITLELLESNQELPKLIDLHLGADVRALAIRIISSDESMFQELLDGPIDVDKMDYVSRDAFHCGLQIGNSLNVDAIASAIQWNKDSKKITYSIRAVSAIESLLVMQDRMLNEVYWHEGVRGLIAMFHAIIAHVIKKDESKLVDLVNYFRTCKDDNEAIEHLISTVEHYSGSDRELLLDLAKQFRHPNSSKIYRPIACYRHDDENLDASRVNVFNAIVSPFNSGSAIPISWSDVSDLRNAFQASFQANGTSILPLQLIIDVPYGKTSRRRVSVSDSSGKQHDITDVSHLKSSIFDTPAIYSSPIRVYLSPTIAIDDNRLRLIKEQAELNFFQQSNKRTSE